MQYIINTNNTLHQDGLGKLISLVEDITKEKVHKIKCDISKKRYLKHLITMLEIAIEDDTVDRDILLQKFCGELKFLQKYYKIVKK